MDFPGSESSTFRAANPRTPDRGRSDFHASSSCTVKRQYKGEKMGIREMRKHTAWYTTGMHGSSTLRNKVNQVETFDALQELLMR